MKEQNQILTEKFAIYCGDCVSVMKQLPPEIVDLSLYSPPFKTKSGGLYQYSSDPQDISNSIDSKEFDGHYEFVIKELHRLTKPVRMTAVHCMDTPTGNSGNDGLLDFPGDVIRLHEKNGWRFTHRYFIWKEPLTVRNRTMMKSLAHRQCCEDSTRCSMANGQRF